MFTFHEPGPLVDEDLELLLVETSPGDSSQGIVPAYHFKMVERGEGTEIGEIHLRVGDTPLLLSYHGHLGYRVVRPFRGHRYASRSIRLLLPLMKKHEMRTVWITCDPQNIASRKTCELAGAELVEIVELPPDLDLYRRGHRHGCRYRLDVACDAR